MHARMGDAGGWHTVGGNKGGPARPWVAGRGGSSVDRGKDQVTGQVMNRGQQQGGMTGYSGAGQVAGGTDRNGTGVAGVTGGLNGGRGKTTLAIGTGELVVRPFFHKSVNTWAISANFLGLGMTAKEVLQMVSTKVVGAEFLKFIPSAEAVEIGFVEEEKMVSALANGMMVKGIKVGMAQCLQWDPRVI